MLLGYKFLLTVTALCLLFSIAAVPSCKTAKRGLPMSPLIFAMSSTLIELKVVTCLSMAVDVNKV